MSTREMIQKINGDVEDQDTIIPDFQNPDTCVFCDDKSYDNIIFQLLRIYYNIKNGKEYKKLDKETCIHHNDKWLKYSHRTGGFMWSAITDHGKKSMTGEEILEVLKNKEEREKLLTEKYDEAKKFTCAAHLYLTVPPENRINRYSNSFTIEDDIPVQNKIIQNKVKTYFTNAIEALRTLDDEETMTLANLENS